MNIDENLTPKQIVENLDMYIVGQKEAKKAVAISLRNRFRRSKVEPPMKNEIVPKNILMKGPTGVGKTEIARKLARVTNCPFIKVESTKFTEVGYVGKDVDSIIRDIIEKSISMIKIKLQKECEEKTREIVEKRIIKKLPESVTDTFKDDCNNLNKEELLIKLKNGDFDSVEIEIEVESHSPSPMASFDIPGVQNAQMGIVNVSDVIGKFLGKQPKKKKVVSIKKAFQILSEEESSKLIDEDQIIRDAVSLVEENGIVFLDEIDKTIKGDARGEVSREGVQRDLLPLIEGTTVMTKYGPIKTNHILFIAAGSFHSAKPSDLLPELQGRLPIKVELLSLTKEDMIRILKDTKYSLVNQYCALLKIDGINLKFLDEAISLIAEISIKMNDEVENIGARRLHSVMEKLLESASFNANNDFNKDITIDCKYVLEELKTLVTKFDLSKFIL